MCPSNRHYFKHHSLHLEDRQKPLSVFLCGGGVILQEKKDTKIQIPRPRHYKTGWGQCAIEMNCAVTEMG